MEEIKTSVPFRRGMLTESVQVISRDFLGREIDTTELRLYPYIDYALKNEGLDIDKLSREEIDLLYDYVASGYVKGFCPTIVTREFYNYLQDVLAVAYVRWE